MKPERIVMYGLPLVIIFIVLISALIIPNHMTSKKKNPKKEAEMFLSDKSKTERLLKSLTSNDHKIIENTKKQLSKYKFQKKDLKHIYSALKKEYKDDTDKYFSTKSKLFRVLWDVNDKSTTKFIKEIYPTLPSNPDIIFSALRTLTEINSPDSLKLLMRILLENKPNIGDSIYTLFVPIEKDKKNICVLFPAILELIKQDYYKNELYYFITNWLYNDAISPEVISGIKDNIINDFEQSYIITEKTDRDNENAKDAVGLLEFTADLLGYHDDKKKTIPLLIKGLGHYEPRVKLYSSLSLIRLNEKVPDEILSHIAEYPLLRLMMYEALEAIGRPELFPNKYLSQYYFAESDMVSWLTFPTEFGRPPDKIEFIQAKIIIDKSGDSGRLYLFKYFYKDDEDGWMVGVSGPQPEDKTKFYKSGYMTFSNWEKLEDMSIEEHFDSFLKDAD